MPIGVIPKPGKEKSMTPLFEDPKNPDKITGFRKIVLIDTYPHGYPIGGLGAGTIGRTPEGDFSTWTLGNGRLVYRNIPAFQFHVMQRESGKKPVAWSLSTNKPKGRELSAFNYGYPKGKGHYFASYPISGFTYDNEKWPVKLICTQFSPVITKNYKESSYPVGVYKWEAVNTSKKVVDLTIMMTAENISGWPITWPNVPHNSELCKFVPKPGDTINEVVGDEDTTSIVMGHKKTKGQFAISVGHQNNGLVTWQKDFDPSASGNVVWKPFSNYGVLDNKAVNAKGKRNAAALAIQLTMKPGEKVEIPFALSWDRPDYERLSRKRQPINSAQRHYTRFFDGNGRNAAKIGRIALANYKGWEKSIIEMQNDLKKRYPAWLANMMANEMYFLADGGTIWDAKTGEFGLLECFDYFFYCTLDVLFYGLFPLVKMWPELAKQIMKQFVAAAGKKNHRKTRYWSYHFDKKKKYAPGHKEQFSGVLKELWALPHDLANAKKALKRLNDYIWRNPNLWKDINSKFVLLMQLVYQNSGKDKKFLKQSWPAIKKSLYYLKKIGDKNNDGMIENNGKDQTYDNYEMKGVSAYCGMLWLASLESAIAMGKEIGKEAETKDFQEWLKKGKPILDKKLWNGKYYDIFEGNKDILTDQLAGQLFTIILGLPSLMSDEKAKSTLREIYKKNVLTFGKGELRGHMGAVNARHADGSPVGHEQADDAWVGANFFLAALMLHYGMKKEGMQILKGINGVLTKKGYFARTPEGFNEEGDFVGQNYLRAMAIWVLDFLNLKF